MYQLSVIINEIYNKYLPLAEKNRAQLDLDFTDTTQKVVDPEDIKTELDQQLSTILKHTNQGKIQIIVNQNEIIIQDSGTILSKPLCRLISKGRISVNSRVGFGTKITIQLHTTPPTDDQKHPHNTKSRQIHQD